MHADDQGLCIRCGKPFYRYAEGTAPTGPPAPPSTAAGWTTSDTARPSSGSRFLRLLAVAVVVVLAVFWWMDSGRVSTPSTSGAGTSGGSAAWAPSGYQVVSADPNVAWKWNAQPACPAGGSCWGMTVIAHAGCPSSLYVEMSVLDGTGAAIGLTNAVTSALTPGQRAILNFSSYETNGKSATPTKFSCY